MGHEANRESEGRPSQTIYSIKHCLQGVPRTTHDVLMVFHSIVFVPLSSSCGFPISHCLLCVCVCLPYYRKFSRNRSFAVFCGFFFKAKILGCGKRTPLLFVTRKTHNFSESQQISFREISPHKITN